MNILVINCGSSSLRFQLIKTGKTSKSLAKGHVDGISLKTCRFIYKSNTKNIGIKTEVKNHKQAVKLALDTLQKQKAINNLKEIDAIGHRVVHGGEKYIHPIKIDSRVIKTIEKLIFLAPLHNPSNLEGIKACKELLKKTQQIAVFDTSYHQSMPEKAWRYALPDDLYQKNNIRRYGFHGASHQYVVNEAIKFLKNKNAKIISCHIGNGVSITASEKGKSVDTSMGFTPLEGVMMGTRSGSVDPEIIFYLQKNLKLKPDKISHLLNNESGLKAISDISSDMRLIYETTLDKNATKSKKEKASLAIEMFSYQIARQISAYLAILNGIDAIVFTAGIGEKAFYIREKILSHFEFIGAKIDHQKNKANEFDISAKNSRLKTLVIPTNEELQIALEVEKTLKK